MKKKEFLKIKEKEKKEIVVLVEKKKEELGKVKMDIVSGKEKNLRKANSLRKEIAQILSIQTT